MYGQAVGQVKVRLALEAIVKLEGLEVTDEELDEEYKKLSEGTGVRTEII